MNRNIIQLISGPRNISTALMYSFGNRKSCHIVDEPFYAYYLGLTKSDHPGKEEIINSMTTDPEQIIDEITNHDLKGDLFIKNMAHHFIGLNPMFSLNFKNIFLIRNTEEILHSFSKVIPFPSLNDIGIKKEWELYEYLTDHGNNPIVIDSGILLSDPETILKKLCLAIDIHFEKTMLQWKPGPRKEDGIWAKYWYGNVHKTSCFKRQNTKEITLKENLKQVNEEAYIYYSKLLEKAIKP